MTGAPLSEFARGSMPARADSSTRITAGLLTALVYALAGLFLWLAALSPPGRAVRTQIVTAMVRETPRKPPVEQKPALPDIRPRVEKPAPPVIIPETGAPPTAPAPLPATAATVSPLVGGTSGNGPMGQSASGAGGSGAGGGGCLDPVWMRAVSERVRQFFHYPPAALASRITGVATIRFGVRRNGQIDKLEVARSSGDDSLDKAAIDILQKAQPLPPIPDRMRVDRVEGELPVNFGVRSFNARASSGNC
jgi:protein TonB